MTLTARLVSRADVVPLIRLGPREGQEGRVAPNAVTIAQGAHEPGARVYGLWEDEAAVGLMAVIDPAEADMDVGDDPEALFLWRLMIDGAHQGRGLGRAALALVEARARAWRRPRVVTSAVEREDGAAPFYERHGYQRTGRMLGDEAELVRRLEG